MMFSLTGNMDINIALRNGVWIFPPESATGKTYLYKQLKLHYLNGEPVVGYSYNDKLFGVHLEHLVDYDRHKVLILDRYDLYSKDFTDIIKKFSLQGIVLIDCKVCPDIRAEYCEIKFTSDLIEVTEI